MYRDSPVELPQRPLRLVQSFSSVAEAAETMRLTVAGHALQSRLFGRCLDVADLVGKLGFDEDDQGGTDELA